MADADRRSAAATPEPGSTTALTGFGIASGPPEPCWLWTPSRRPCPPTWALASDTRDAREGIRTSEVRPNHSWNPGVARARGRGSPRGGRALVRLRWRTRRCRGPRPGLERRPLSNAPLQCSSAPPSASRSRAAVAGGARVDEEATGLHARVRAFEGPTQPVPSSTLVRTNRMLIRRMVVSTQTTRRWCPAPVSETKDTPAQGDT